MTRWSQREIVVVAAIGAVFGIVYLAWAQLWHPVELLVGPLALDVLFGLWCTASVVAAFAVRKPFAAFFAEVVAAAAEVVTGNPAGLILLLTGVVQGAGAELPFLLTGWKRYDWPVLVASGASAAVFSFVYCWFRFNYGALDTRLLAAMLVVRILSGVLLSGVLGRAIAMSLHRTGSLQGLGIDDGPRAAAA